MKKYWFYAGVGCLCFCLGFLACYLTLVAQAGKTAHSPPLSPPQAIASVTQPLSNAFPAGAPADRPRAIRGSAQYSESGDGWYKVTPGLPVAGGWSGFRDMSGALRNEMPKQAVSPPIPTNNKI